MFATVAPLRLALPELGRETLVLPLQGSQRISPAYIQLAMTRYAVGVGPSTTAPSQSPYFGPTPWAADTYGMLNYPMMRDTQVSTESGIAPSRSRVSDQGMGEKVDWKAPPKPPMPELKAQAGSQLLLLSPVASATDPSREQDAMPAPPAPTRQVQFGDNDLDRPIMPPLPRYMLLLYPVPAPQYPL
jgi:hypothetical protein